MRLIPTVLLALTLCSQPTAFAASPGSGASPGSAASPGSEPYAEAIKLYKVQKYDDAIKVLNDRLADNPDDAVAKYYLANCWLGTGRLDVAQKKYESCLKSNPPPYMKSYAKQMLAEITRRKNAPPPVNNNYAINDEAKFDQAIEDMKRRVRERHQDEAKSRIESLQTQVDRLRREQTDTLTFDIPDFYYGRRGRTIRNPQATQFRASTNQRILQLQNEIAVIRKKLRDTIERADSQIDNTFAELASQARATTGNIKPLLTSRSIYVRDYIHFSGEEPPPDFMIAPLKATPGKYKYNP
jgi:tetratricopeptide (TPR) repeat protein